MREPKVYLVGAGPGDPSLLTLRAAELLARAEVLVYDRLVSPAILGMVAPTARRLYVGKSPGAHAATQGEINQILIEHGRTGQVVVRLKGGDPLVFGRGGEEALALRQAGIDFEIVPGITAGIAGPAYAGIPVTHRGLTSAVAFVTGHEDPTKGQSDLDYAALARIGTLVFYMGINQLSRIADGLMAAGLAADTPAAVVEQATTADQRVVRASLQNLAAEVAAQGVRPPALTVIGQVASLREQLAWVERRPLWGRRIVVTRTRQQGSQLATMLREQGAEVLQMPTLRIGDCPDQQKQLDETFGRLDSYKWLVLTSPNGAERLWQAMCARGLDWRRLAGLQVAAIGPGTAGRLRELGLLVDLTPERAVGESLAEALLASGVGSGCRVLLARAQDARDVVPDRLRAAGAEVDVLDLYRNEVPEEADEQILELLCGGRVDIITLTSSSTAEHFVELLRRHLPPAEVPRLLKRLAFAAIGPITAATARELKLPVVIESQQHTIEGLVEAITGWASVDRQQ